MPLSPATETTILAALALAACQYADPTPCYAAIREFAPETNWDDWVASVEKFRATKTTPEEGGSK